MSKLDLDLHAKNSADIRRAAELAGDISKNLHKLNVGPVFDYETKKTVESTDAAFKSLASILGYELAGSKL